MSSAALPFEPPRPISRKVSRLRSAVRLYVLVEGLAALGAVVGAAFWVGLAIDWFLEPRPALRVVMWLVAAAAAGWVAWRFILRRVFATLHSDSLALLVERQYPQLREGFITTVQAHSHDPASPVTRQLLDASARHTTEALAPVRLRRVFDFRPLVRKLAAAAVLLGGIALFAATRGEAFGFWLDRMRLSPELWPRLASLTVVGFEDESGDRVVNVARDDAFELSVLASIVDGHQAPAEVEVRWRLADGRRGRGPMLRIGEAVPGRDQAQLYQYTFKVSADVVFDVVGGDDRVRNLRLHPVERPSVARLDLDCTFPGYMHREPLPVAVSSGRASLPEGTAAVCAATANKPLRSVVIHDPAEQVDLPATVDPQQPAQFRFDLGRVTGDRVLLVTMHDADGVSNRDPFRLSVSVVPDAPPEVNVQLRGIGTAVTPQARIPFAGRLLDDYGLVDAWFEYEVADGASGRRPLRTQPEGLANLRMTEPFDLAEAEPGASRPRLELKPGQKLTLSVRARDAYDLGDQPHEGGSPRFQLDVVTESELRALLEKRELGLRQRFEAIYEKMLGVCDLLDRIDLAASGAAAQDGASSGGEAPADGAAVDASAAAGDDELSPLRRRERDLSRIGGSRQSATQLAFETTGVAEGFDDILAELVNNRVDTEELNERLAHGIAEPLKHIGGELLPRFEEHLAALQAQRSADSPETARSLAASRTESREIAAAMKAALDRMLELEGYNELVELLRGIVADQDALREQTLEEQRQSVRDLEK
jgi:hypothetical protein